MKPAERLAWTEFYELTVRKYGIDASDRIVRYAQKCASHLSLEVSMAKALNWWESLQYQPQD